MEEEEMSFDAPAATVSEPVKRKLSRLKRAVPILAPSTAAQQHLPHVSNVPQALVDRTNTDSIRKQGPPTSPELSPERGSLGAASSPVQTSANPSPTCSPQPAHTSSENHDSEQPAQIDFDAQADQPPKSPAESDYWDSEDELEAELTRRERAEGFHADSSTSSEGKAAPAQDSESDSDSCVQNGSPDSFKELNSQTQRVLRDGAKRDTIGQGQAIQRQALSGVLGKILSRKDAIAMRAPAIPVPPAKQDKQTKVSPKALAARLREQAGKLVVKAAAPENDDILVLSGDESDQDTPNEDAVLADASHSLKQAKQLVAQHKTQPPHQNRLGLPVGAIGRAPEDDTQEMGFDSIPFEEPELFTAKSGLEAKDRLADRQDSMLQLRLDSQDDLGSSLAEDGGATAQVNKETQSESQAMNLSGAEEEECGSKDNDATPGCSGGDVSEGGASQSGEDEDEHSSKDGSSDHTSTSGRGSEDGQSSAAEQEDNTEDCEDAEGSDTNQEADCPWSEANSKDQNPEGTEWWKKARQKQVTSKQQEPLFNEFVDEEAEMSEDEGHSQGGSDDDADEDGDLEDLIGQGKDRKGDEARRAKLHQQWLEQQDAQQVAQLMQGVRNGFRRKRAGDFLDEDEGNDWDARKRRARKDADDDSILSDEEEDRLAGLIHLDEDDNEDAALTEQAKQQLRNATALKGGDTDGGGSIDLDAGSQEILALLSATSQSNISRQTSKLPAMLTSLPGSHKAPAGQKATFMGRSMPSMAGARGASQMASRSYVFGRDDSNSAAAPSNAQVSGPTSFSGLGSIIREGSSQPAGPVSLKQTGRESNKKSSLLGRLAGKGNRLGGSAGSVSTVDLQSALATSFGVQAAARANSALRR